MFCTCRIYIRRVCSQQTSLKAEVDARHLPHSKGVGVGMEESSFLEAITRQIPSENLRDIVHTTVNCKVS
jgi:hypothetical protein